MNHRGRFAIGPVILGLSLLASSPAAGHAQVGDTSDVNYPGWIAADGASPVVTVALTYDDATGVWTYDYTFQNQVTADQPIEAVDLRFFAPDLPGAAASAPAGWVAPRYSPPGVEIPGVSFMTFVNEPAGVTRLASPNQIPAGAVADGFRLENPYPPGYARAYVKGYVPLPAVSESDFAEEAINVPHDTTNSQRRWTLGPTQYQEVVTGGNRRPATDGFLGFMNLSEKSSILTDPAPIALEFSLNGETVFTETLEVKLNGVDVTDAFHPGADDGADLVGVFSIGSSPLQEGKNVLLTSVDGIVPSNGNTGKDADRIVFLVDPSLAESGTASSTFALDNLPFPEPGLDLD